VNVRVGRVYDPPSAKDGRRMEDPERAALETIVEGAD
jgi:hypothetical protein